MKNLTKVLAVAVVATMALSSISVFAAETETTTDFDRPAFSMNVGARKGNFKFGKLMNLTDEQKAAMAEKIESGEFKLGEKSFGKKMFNGEKPELTEEQKAAITEKIESGEFKLGERNFGKMKGKMPGKKVFNGEKPELTEEQKAARAEKIASGEFKPMAKAGKGMKNFAKKAPKLNANSTEVAE